MRSGRTGAGSGASEAAWPAVSGREDATRPSSRLGYAEPPCALWLACTGYQGEPSTILPTGMLRSFGVLHELHRLVRTEGRILGSKWGVWARFWKEKGC